jgi:hypothetical protein
MPTRRRAATAPEADPGRAPPGTGSRLGAVTAPPPIRARAAWIAAALQSADAALPRDPGYALPRGPPPIPRRPRAARCGRVRPDHCLINTM